jgi:tRNA(Ile)-lysidine synthase
MKPIIAPYYRSVADPNPNAAAKHRRAPAGDPGQAPEAHALYAALRPDPAVAEIIRSWRSLTGGAAVRDADRCTLIACSGGADSSALALSLAAAAPQAIALAHIVHDLRPAQEALADRDAVMALAARLGVPFVEASVAVRALGGNLEAAARHARYAELGRLAALGTPPLRDGCAAPAAERRATPYVATAHQGDDQLETILMRLLRGSGPRGLAGIRPSRPLAGSPARLIRPMLGVSREDSERICALAGHEWREDVTNRDTTRLRAALRLDIIPRLKALAPGAVARARTTGELLADAADLIHAHAADLLAKAEATTGGHSWPRDVLRGQSPLILGTMLRLVAARLTRDAGLDRLAWRLVRPVVSAIRDDSTDPRRFEWQGVDVLVSAHSVEIRRETRMH